MHYCGTVYKSVHVETDSRRQQTNETPTITSEIFFRLNILTPKIDVVATIPGLMVC